MQMTYTHVVHSMAQLLSVKQTLFSLLHACTCYEEQITDLLATVYVQSSVYS